MLPVFQIILLDHVAGNSLSYVENTSDLQSRYYQTVLRFQI